jgi:hypothetical protein
LSSLFSNDGKLVYCSDVEGLLQELGCTNNAEEWRLFVDSPKFSLKMVLLIAYPVHLKEIYENMYLLLKAVSYSKYGWKICGDLKVIGLLLGMQPGYTVLLFSV